MTTSSFIFTLLLLGIVGAFIGGITNHLAIKMLFRPYRALYIGKFRVPFTPGVIPKRHGEIAVQLGNLVMKHLITAEGIEKRFKDPRFRNVIVQRVTDWADYYLSEKRPTKDDLLAYFPIDAVSKNVELQLIEGLQVFVKKQVDQHKEATLKDLLPLDLLETIENQLPEFSRHIADSIRSYFQTEEAKAMVQTQLDRFFEGRGMLGNMLNMFLGNQSLVDKFYPDFLNVLERPTVQLTLHSLLEKEWEKLQGKKLEELSVTLNLEAHSGRLIDTLIKATPLKEFMENPGIPLSKWKEPLLSNVIPVAIDILLEKASVEAASLLQSLELDTLVSEQVREFSLKELEDVILIISKKEFKMITYLGAILGGGIGVIQAFIMLLFQR
ncbi:MAG TPA: DUF445 family protein [Candidatus Angelobacter sp.]|nr:DUF445 family protein [Candidatus Angelobacter sp.]